MLIRQSLLTTLWQQSNRLLAPKKGKTFGNLAKTEDLLIDLLALNINQILRNLYSIIIYVWIGSVDIAQAHIKFLARPVEKITIIQRTKTVKNTVFPPSCILSKKAIQSNSQTLHYSKDFFYKFTGKFWCQFFFAKILFFRALVDQCKNIFE